MKKVALALVLLFCIPVVAQEGTTPSDTNHQYVYEDTYITVGRMVVDVWCWLMNTN